MSGPSKLIQRIFGNSLPTTQRTRRVFCTKTNEFPQSRGVQQFSDISGHPVYPPVHVLHNWSTALHLFLQRLSFCLDPSVLQNCPFHCCLQNINTFAASYLNTQGLNNSCLKSPASTSVDLTFQSRALRSFSLNKLHNLSLQAGNLHSSFSISS